MTECPKCKSFDIEIKESYKFFDIYECKICKYWTYKRIEDCCRNSYEIVTIDRKTHELSFIYRQCINCGGSTNRTSPLSHKKYGDSIRGEFDYDSYERWQESKYAEKEQLSVAKKNYNFYTSPYYKYIEYLNSKKWKDKRNLVFERDNYKCQECKEKNADDVHHLTYDNLGNENLNELVSVCRECHKKIHDMK